MANLDKLSIVVEIDEQKAKASETRLDGIIDKLKTINTLSQNAKLGESYGALAEKIKKAETKLAELTTQIANVKKESSNISSKGIEDLGTTAKKTGKALEDMTSKMTAKEAFNFANSISDAERLRTVVEGLSKELADAINQNKSVKTISRLQTDIQKYTAEWENAKRQTALVVADTNRALTVVERVTASTENLSTSFSQVAKEVEYATKNVRELWEQSSKDFVMRGDPYTKASQRMVDESQKTLPAPNERLLLTGKVEWGGYEKFNQWLDSIPGKVSNAKSSISGMWNTVTNGVSTTIGKVQGVVAEIQGRLQPIFNVISKVRAFITGVYNAAKKVWGVVEKVWGATQKVWGATKKVGSAVGSLVSSIGKLGLAMGKISGFPFKPITKGIDTIYNKIGKVIKQILKMVKMRIYRLIAKQIISGFTEGLKNAYQFSKVVEQRFAESMDKIATSSLYLKNSLGALAMPILNALAPALDILVDKVVAVINKINELIARLALQKSWTKAVKYPTQFAKGLDEATGSAEKLNKELITILGIDEINPLEGMNDTPSGSGSGLADALDYGSMFEEVTEFSQGAKDLAEMIQEAWESSDFTKVGEFVGEKLSDALSNIPWTTLKTKAENIGKSIATFINGALIKKDKNQNTLLDNIAITVAEGLNTAFIGAGAFAKYFKATEIGESLGTAIGKGLDAIDWDAIKTTADTAGEKLAGFINGSLLVKDKDGNTVSQKLGISMAKSINTVFSATGKFFTTLKLGDIGKEIGKAIIGGLGTIQWEGTGGIKETFKTIGTKLANFINGLFAKDKDGNTVFTSIGSTIGNAINTAVGGAKSFITTTKWTELGNNVAGGINTFIDTVDFTELGTTISDGIRGAFDFLNELIDKTKWEEFGREIKKAIKAVDWWNDVIIPAFNLGGKIIEIPFRFIFGDDFVEEGNTYGISGHSGITTDQSHAVETGGGYYPIYDEHGNYIGSEYRPGTASTYKPPSNSQVAQANLFKDTPGMKADLLAQEIAKALTGGGTNPGMQPLLGTQFSPIETSLSITGLKKDDKFTMDKDLTHWWGYITGESGASGFKRSEGLRQWWGYITGQSGASGFKRSEGLRQWWAYITGQSGASGFKRTVGLTQWWAYVTGQSGAKGFTRTTGLSQWWSYITGQSGASGFKRTVGLSQWWSYITGQSGAKGFSRANALTQWWSYITGQSQGSGFERAWALYNFLTYATGLEKASNFKPLKLEGKITGGGANTASLELKKLGGVFSNGKWHSIPQYATGGLPSHGSLFLAGESGSELVGHVGGRTEVLNQSQLASTMYSSVMSANASQNRLLQEQNSLLREMLSKQGDSRAYVVASDLVDGMSQMNRRDGRTLVAMGV